MNFYFLCNSSTHAIKGRKLLRNEGIETAVRRAPASMGRRGCGYVVEVADRDARQAVSLFNQTGVSYKGIYAAGNRGYREVSANDLP